MDMNFNSKFEAEKNALVESINKTNATLDSLIVNNLRVNLLNREQNEKLTELKNKNEILKRKIISNEFEIAIVGLEKAGKSTFANALMKSNILPSAPERCTFTSTRLVNGNDQARVKFYTEEQFEATFQALLEEIEYPHQAEIGKTSFRSLSIESFEQYFNLLETENPALYKSHIGKTDEEIKDILKSRDRLILTGETKSFSGEDLKSDSFKSYIKGDNQGKDTSKPRSVCSIEIESSELTGLDNAIIYDVPGFDSPTKIHMRQTEERLKAADAIILVTNVGTNPSLQGTTLSVITKNTDADGIALKDKLFVFGNQLDRVNDESQLKSNPNILIADVEKYKIGDRKRVFTGSAYKYLFDEKIITDATFKNNIESGIDAIREALVKYYQTERFEILKRKFGTNRKLMQSILEEVLILHHSDLDANFSEDSERAKIAKTAYKKAESSLHLSLKKLQDTLKNEVYEQKYFTNKFRSSVQDNAYFPEVTHDDFEQQRLVNSDSVRCDLPIEKINHSIRDKVHKEYLESFSHLIKEMTDGKSKEIEVRILNSFTSAICGDNNSAYSDIEDMCSKYIYKVTREVAHGDNSFTYLLERFSRDVFDVLLSSPIVSKDRKNRYTASSKEFSYLDSYYSGGRGTLISIILAQKEESLLADGIFSVRNHAETLRKLASSSGNSAYLDKLDSILDILGKSGLKLELRESSDMVNDLLDQVAFSADEAQVLKEINTDIENLIKVLQVAVIPASNLELVFMNGVDKQIKRLISAFKDEASLYSELWDDFISKIIPIIKKEELDDISYRLETNKMKKELLEQIQEIVKPLH